jgi:hypothetical protein
MISTPLTVHTDDYIFDEDELQAVRECRRLLLEAGADPTLMGDEEINIVNILLTDGSPVSLYWI